MSFEVTTNTIFTGTLENNSIKTFGGIWIKNTTIDTGDIGFSGSYTLLNVDSSLDVIGTTVGCTISLGSPQTYDAGRQVIIKNSTSLSTVTISSSIESIANRVIFPGETITVMFNGVAWEIISILRKVVKSEISSFPHQIKYETYVIATGTGNVVLPASSSLPTDKTITIKNIGDGVITVTPTGQDTIDTNLLHNILAKQSFTYLPYSSGYVLI